MIRSLFIIILFLSWMGLGIPAVSATVIDVTVSGGDAIFLAGRTDIIIPPVSQPWNTGSFLQRHPSDNPAPEGILERIPLSIDVHGGDIIRVADLGIGGMNLLMGFGPPFFGPNGFARSSGELLGLDGISGFKGPVGSLTGVFLSSAIPSAGPSPLTLDFSETGIGTEFSSLEPLIGQVFYIGDGVTAAGAYQTFKAPTSANRFFLGIADGNFFFGPPGFYGDNDGSYVVRVGVNAIPSVIPEPASIAIWGTAALGFSLFVRRRLAR